MFKKAVALLLIKSLFIGILSSASFALSLPGLGEYNGAAALIRYFQASKNITLPKTNIVPVITPLTNDGDIDEKGIIQYMAHLKYLGVKAILAMGATGEFDKLDNDKRLKAIEIFAREGKKHNIMVFAHATGDRDKPGQTIDNIKKIQDMSKDPDRRIDAVVVAPLYFLFFNNQIKPYFIKMSEELEELTLPVLLYNNPFLAKDKGANIDKEVVEELHEYIAGIKDSSGNMEITSGYMRACDAVYVGNENQVLEAMELGAQGCVGSTGSILTIFNSITEGGEGDHTKMQQVFTRKIRNNLTVKCTKIPAGLKYVLSLMGICNDIIARDNTVLTFFQKEDIRRTIFTQYFLKDFIDAFFEHANNKGNPHQVGHILSYLLESVKDRKDKQNKYAKIYDVLQQLNIHPAAIDFKNPAAQENYIKSVSGITDGVLHLAQVKPLEGESSFGVVMFELKGTSIVNGHSSPITDTREIRNKRQLEKLINNLKKDSEQDYFVTIYLKDYLKDRSFAFLQDLSRSLKTSDIAFGIFISKGNGAFTSDSNTDIFIFKFTDYHALYQHIRSIQKRRFPPSYVAILINGEKFTVSDLKNMKDQKVITRPAMVTRVLRAIRKIFTSL